MECSQPHGTTTSQIEVTNVSRYGVWILAHGKELFLAYDDFPWFKDACIRSVRNVEEPSPGHFYWPELDVDAGLETIEHPERFPLQSRVDA